MSSLLLEIVTPERTVFSQEVTMVVASTVDGQIGILANHIPLVTVLEIGVMRVQISSGQKFALAIGGGFLEISPDNKVTVLAETAELAAEIDAERARQAADRAQQRIDKSTDSTDIARAEIALRRALARLRAAGQEE